MSFSFVRVFIGGLAIIASFAGWGWLVVKVLRLPETRLTIGRNAAIGMALSTIVGGALNLFQQVIPLLDLVYLTAGVLLSICALVKSRSKLPYYRVKASEYARRHKIVFSLASLLCLFALVKYSAAVSPGSFHPDDDYLAYFTFPVKMIETGSLGQDPFSYRRLSSSLGGQVFLDTFSLVIGDVRNLHLIDQGVAFLILLLMFAEIAIAKAVDVRWILLLVLGIELYQPPAVNISSLYTSVVLFLLLFTLLDGMAGDSSHQSRLRSYSSQATLLAITLASLVSLKYSATPAAGLLGLTYFALLLQRSSSWRKTLANAAFSVGLTVLFLLPWMWSAYQSSGTPFFGLLGHGFHGSRYGTAVLPTQVFRFQNLLAMVHNVQYVLLAILIVLTILLFKERQTSNPSWIVDFSIVASMLISVAVITVEMGGFQISRLSFPLVMAAVLYTIAGRARLFPPSELSLSPNFLSSQAVAVLLVGLFVGAALNSFFLSTDSLLSALWFSVTGQDIISRSEAAEFQQMQSTVPKGQRLMVRLSKNFLPDFKRNPIYIVDNPGLVSLPPGMPAFRGPERLATYLLGKQIRYLAYSYVDGGGLTNRQISNIFDPKSGTNAWILSNTKLAVDFQDNLLRLALSRKKLFDDGRIFVLDLAQFGRESKVRSDSHPKVGLTESISQHTRSSIGVRFNER
jgi:hypothetical protein